MFIADVILEEWGRLNKLLIQYKSKMSNAETVESVNGYLKCIDEVANRIMEIQPYVDLARKEKKNG